MKKLTLEKSAEVPLYSEEILALAAAAGKGNRLAKCDASAQEIGALCGSRIIIDVVWEPTTPKKTAEFGYSVDACALGTASAAIFASAVLGKGEAETRRLFAEMKKMLKGEAFCFKDIQDWQKFSLLQAAQFHKSRHDAILLQIKALLNAFKGDKNEPV